MPSRAFVAGVSVGLLGLACVSSPQEESTALADPEPVPVEAPVVAADPEPLLVEDAEPGPGAAGTPTTSEPATNASTPAAITGIPVCDEYLSLYRRCEEHLEPQIMAGNRRPYRSEEGSLQYVLGTPEAAGLPDSCRSMLDALQVDCPPQHRNPPEPTP